MSTLKDHFRQRFMEDPDTAQMLRLGEGRTKADTDVLVTECSVEVFQNVMRVSMEALIEGLAAVEANEAELTASLVLIGWQALFAKWMDEFARNQAESN